MPSEQPSHPPLPLGFACLCVCSLFSVGNFLDMWKVSWEGPWSDLPCDQHRRWSLLSACLETQERERWAGLAGQVEACKTEATATEHMWRDGQALLVPGFFKHTSPKAILQDCQRFGGFFLFQDQTEIGLYGWRFARIREKLESAWVQSTPGYFTRGAQASFTFSTTRLLVLSVWRQGRGCMSMYFLESRVHS